MASQHGQQLGDHGDLRCAHISICADAEVSVMVLMMDELSQPKVLVFDCQSHRDASDWIFQKCYAVIDIDLAFSASARGGGRGDKNVQG